ncbi:MAG: ATP-dependent Clp protease proteolytic subunit [Candidatus Latescibacterota bacterium]|nr:ATP-dependent Clp protease proteolytic subunit [Candidatus Latescibacterota bacterium]
MAEKEKDEGLLTELSERNIEYSLLKTRKIFLWSSVHDDSARAVVTRLLSLDAEDPEAEIVLYINSPGGAVHDGLAIYDAMQAISAPVSTVCTGLAASMGAVLLAGGEKSRRFTWPHARIMIHQPLIMGTITGRATDLDIHAREMIRTREEINRLLAHHTGQDVEQISRDTDRDFYMSPDQAKDYGLIDDIIETSVMPSMNGKK